MQEITKGEIGKTKARFTIRFVHKDHPDDELLPEAFFKHNQAAFKFFLTTQEKADERLEAGKLHSYFDNIAFDVRPIAAANNNDLDAVKPMLSVKPFVKRKTNGAFYVVPVTSPGPFPQFKAARVPGVLRGRRQTGMCPVPCIASDSHVA